MDNKPYTRKFQVSTPIKNGEDPKASYWVKCGMAFENAKSGQITIKLDVIPAQRENGKIVLVLFEDKGEVKDSA